MKTLSAIAISTIFAAFALGCDNAAPADDTLETATLALIEGSPEAVGLLEFLNDPSTTVDVLDYDVPLNRRSARNIIHYRDGYDGIAGTYDDNLFDHISEVDSVRWVGKAAMASLAYFAHSQNWVPEGDDVLGTWDGVVFTADEAELTLALANASDEQTLDHDLGLDRRAAAAIVAAQPVESIADLSTLYFVGTSALTILKDAALSNDALSLDARFAQDLSRHLEEWFALYGDDAIAEGGRSLEEAQAAVSSDNVSILSDTSGLPLSAAQEGHDVVAHPEVIFADSEVMWFGIYDATTGTLIEIGRF